VDQHGTYPLPEAQLDRFAMKLSVGYPAAADEVRMLQDAVGSLRSGSDVQPVLSLEQLSRIQESVASLSVAPNVQNYLVRLAQETRRHTSIALGLSPRGLLTWQRVAQSHAWLSGRTFVTPDDVQQVAVPVLSVRIGLDPAEAETVIQEIITDVPVPVCQE
jgi:MoxR-like ATPase